MINGEKYTIMNCTLPRILKLCQGLIQVNKSELISPRVFHGIDYDVVTLKMLPGKNMPQIVMVGRVYKKKLVTAMMTR